LRIKEQETHPILHEHDDDDDDDDKINKRIGWFPLEDDGVIILQNIGNRSLKDTASYPESLQS
jgi:hypothetical protein